MAEKKPVPKKRVAVSRRRVTPAKGAKSSKTPSTPLTQRQLDFCVVYVETGNATEAYRRVYSTANMKEATVGRRAKELMDDGRIAARIQEMRDAAAKAAQVSQERVLSELAAQAFYDPADLVLIDPEDPTRFVNINSPLDIRKLPDKVRRCIVGWSWDRNMNFVLKLANKTSALELIGRHLAMFVDRKEIKVSELQRLDDDGLNARIAQAAAQIAKEEGIPVETVLRQVREGGTVH